MRLGAHGHLSTTDESGDHSTIHSQSTTYTTKTVFIATQHALIVKARDGRVRLKQFVVISLSELALL